MEDLTRIAQIWALVFGISALACGNDDDDWTAPDHFERGSSGAWCGNAESTGRFHGYCSDPEETCIHSPYNHGGAPNESDCGNAAGRCTKDVRDRYLTNPPGDTEDLGPVCGCDGITYASPYEALDEGVSIDEYGRCPQPTGDDCGPTAGSCAEGETCMYPTETNCGEDGTGTCRMLPEQCPYQKEPVCGCDGNTYRNKCEARDAGISVRHTGECTDQSMGFQLPTVPELTREERARRLPHISFPSTSEDDSESSSGESVPRESIR